jgi:TPR repeat protein/type II secretory pathway predicted ATPase ExeA
MWYWTLPRTYTAGGYTNSSMYEAFYHLNSNPFRLTPDPMFCFSHAGYKSAREYLEYALKLGEGFIMVTGQPGTGKTTLAETFLKDVDTSSVSAKRVAVSGLEADDLLRAVAFAYGIEASGLDKATLRHRIQQYFILQEQRGRRALLIIDEAQGLPPASLEELRLLADLQAGSRPLMQLFLVGQESLRDLMSTPGMNQFQQRIIATCHLKPLGLRETRAYIKHRLCQAGWTGDPELTGAALLAIHQWTRGVPRHINKLCNRLLVLGYGKGKHILDEEEVRAISVELREEQLTSLDNDHQTSDGFSTPRPMEEHGDEAISPCELALDKNSIEVEKPNQSAAPPPVTRPKSHAATRQSRQTAVRRIEARPRARRASQPVKSSASRVSSDFITEKMRQRNAPRPVRLFTVQKLFMVGTACGVAAVVIAAMLMPELTRFYGEEHTERATLADEQRALTKPSLLAHGGKRENKETMIPHTGQQGPTTRIQATIPAETPEKPAHRQFNRQPAQSFTTEEAKGDLKHGLISRLESLPPTAAGMENDTTSTAANNDNTRTTTSNRHFANEANPSVSTESLPNATMSVTGTAKSEAPVSDDSLMRLQKLAEYGNAQAQSILGHMYATGDGVPENAAKAAEWLEKAAAQGDADAQTVLARMYRNENGVPKNAETSAAADSKSATERNVNEQYNPEVITPGAGMPKNTAKTAGSNRKSAPQEIAKAQNNLRLNSTGDDKSMSRGKALLQLQIEAAEGDASAQYKLGMMYRLGEGVPENAAKAAVWFANAAAQGNANAQYDLGVMYRIGEGVSENPAKAVEWLEKAAAQGNANAQYNLGMMYDAGDGVPIDPAKAMEWFQKAAEQGDAKAQNKVGMMYAIGDGVPVAFDKAMEWFHKSAMRGYSNAQFNLGKIYATGDGVPKNAAKAIEWFKKAAAQGDVDAQFRLGMMYRTGEGVPRNDAKAIEWFKKAAAQGNSDAQFNLGMMNHTAEGMSKDRQ